MKTLLNRHYASRFYISKFFLLTTLIISISFNQTYSQPGIGISYIFSRDSGVTASIALTNQVIPSPNQDDFAYRFAPAGMNLKFGCLSITNFVVSTNGWMALLPAGTPAGIPATLSADSYLSTNQLSNNTSGFPIIAPYWDDLASTIISYNYTAPVLTVQWTCRINKTAVTAANNFWAKIDGSTGVITYSYANNPSYVVAGPPSASIGIAGTCVGDYYSYDNVSNYADSTLETSNIPNKPVNVQYDFTPYQKYENCTNARTLSIQSGTCIPETHNINNALASGSPISCSPSGTDSLDVWFKVSKQIGITTVTVTTSPAVNSCQNLSGTSIEVYSTCGGSPISCSTTSISNPTFGELVLTRPPGAELLYFRVTADNGSCGNFDICATGSGCQAVINNGDDTINDCGTGTVYLHAWIDTFSTYMWTLNGIAISTSDSVTATQPGIYHLTVTGGSCPGTDSVFVNLTSPITLSFTGLDTLYCHFDPLVILTPSHSPGLFSGPGINGNTFDPLVAGIGIHTITYDYITSSGCLFSTSQNTRVDICGRVSDNRSFGLGVFPNPNPGDFYVLAFSNTEKMVTMDIKDIEGRLLKSEKVALKCGENKIPFHSTLAKGVYLLSISDETDSVSLKMVVD